MPQWAQLALAELTDDFRLWAENIKAVVDAFNNPQLTGHTCLAKPVCIWNAFVAEHVG